MRIIFYIVIQKRKKIKEYFLTEDTLQNMPITKIPLVFLYVEWFLSYKQTYIHTYIYTYIDTSSSVLYIYGYQTRYLK